MLCATSCAANPQDHNPRPNTHAFREAREASRINGGKSRGPTSPEGKNVSKFNGVTHGLCAVHLILPGEDPAALDAELQAWDNDWNPPTHTRAVLVRRAAIASWRLNRAVKAEAAWLGSAPNWPATPSTSSASTAPTAPFPAATDPGGALSLLEMDATGHRPHHRLLRRARARLEAGPTAWDQPHYHQRLMLVTRHRLDENPYNAGPIPKASARLLAANNAEFADNPCFDYGHCVFVVPLPGGGARGGGRAAEACGGREGPAAPRAPAPRCPTRRSCACAVAAAYCDGSEEGKLRHRYEMAIDRGLRATIQQLVMLEKSGADLPDDDPQPHDTERDTKITPASPESPTAAAPGSVARLSPGSSRPGRSPQLEARRPRIRPPRAPAAPIAAVR